MVSVADSRMRDAVQLWDGVTMQFMARNQARDRTGKWSRTGGGGAGAVAPAKVWKISGAPVLSKAEKERDPLTKVNLKETSTRAWTGEVRPTKTKLSLDQQKRIGESATQEHLRRTGMPDAGPANIKVNNYAVDLRGDHAVIEVKASTISNTNKRWKATIGGGSAREKNWLKNIATPEEKSKYFKKKEADIMQRKRAARAELQKELGPAVKVKGMTITSIINPDTRTIDIFEFDGFHLRIGFTTANTEKAYRGSYTY